VLGGALEVSDLRMAPDAVSAGTLGSASRAAARSGLERLGPYGEPAVRTRPANRASTWARSRSRPM